MQKTVFVTGGAGFVGSAVIDELLSRDHKVIALARGADLKEWPGVTVIKGDLLKPTGYQSAIVGCDAVIHLVGIIMENPSKRVTFERIHVEGTRAIVGATIKAGVQRYLHMSALGTRPGAASEYHRTKYEAEQIVQKSPLDWTIFRPSLIHGPRGAFMKMEAAWARGGITMPFMPYFGGGIAGQKGAGLLQPIYVKDVARAFVDALENDKTIKETYALAGSQTLTWPQLHETVARQIKGKRRLTFAIPTWAGNLLSTVGIGPLLGFNRSQIIMSQEDNTANLAKFEKDFGWQPASFADSFTHYAPQMTIAKS